jgi:hypothetical protein
MIQIYFATAKSIAENIFVAQKERRNIGKRAKGQAEDKE